MDSETSLEPTQLSDRDWLAAFENEHGRPLRVLHFGNIANNAYLNAKILRKAGIDAHVISYNYGHIMGLPEWEDVELLSDYGSDFQPRFAKQDLKGYQRPKWFIDGTLLECRIRSAELCGLSTSRLERALNWLLTGITATVRKKGGSVAAHAAELLLSNPTLFLFKLKRRLSTATQDNQDARQHDKINGNESYLIELFAKYFPDRADQLTASDLSQYASLITSLEKLFAPYDIVQCYGTDPIYALISRKRPYITFEHGTLRAFTMDDDPLHRLTGLAYRNADHTFVTNGDCLAYARKLGIEHYSAMIHPIDVDQHRRDFAEDVAEIRKETKADVLLFCPTRHDFEIKGTDQFIHALPEILRRTEKSVRIVLVDWGHDIAESKRLLSQYGIQERVIWRKPMSRITMIKYLQAADVVFDQMVLPVFGSTAPQSIATGTPVIASYVPEETAWLIPEPAPILSAYTPEEVAEQTIRSLNQEWLASYRQTAKRWTDRYHGPSTILTEHMNVYRRVLDQG